MNMLERDPNQKTLRSRTAILLKRMLWGVALVYLSAMLLLVALENQLVYPGSKYPRGNWQPTEFSFQEVNYTAADGTELVGWFLEGLADPAAPPQSKETVLLFHGNAENVAQAARRMGVPLRDALHADVFVAEYRGYGKSSGSANEPGILLDAEAALKWICERKNQSADQVIIAGHSLGGGPACYLAGTKGCKALVLDRTFDSLVSAAQANYPIFPVKWLMRNRLSSDVWIESFTGPLFISHGDKDTLIPIDCAERLFQLAPAATKEFYLVPGWGHWDRFPPNYWKDLADFCRQIEAPVEEN